MTNILKLDETFWINMDTIRKIYIEKNVPENLGGPHPEFPHDVYVYYKNIDGEDVYCVTDDALDSIIRQLELHTSTPNLPEIPLQGPWEEWN